MCSNDIQILFMRDTRKAPHCQSMTIPAISGVKLYNSMSNIGGDGRGLFQLGVEQEHHLSDAVCCQ